MKKIFISILAITVLLGAGVFAEDAMEPYLPDEPYLSEDDIAALGVILPEDMPIPDSPYLSDEDIAMLMPILTEPAPVAVADNRLPARMIPWIAKPTGIYKVQVGAFSRIENAHDFYERLVSAGFTPDIERHNNLLRVVIAGVKAADLTNVAQRLGYADFSEIWIRR